MSDGSARQQRSRDQKKSTDRENPTRQPADSKTIIREELDRSAEIARVKKARRGE